MTLSIDIASMPIRTAVETIVRGMGATIAPTPDAADVVVSDDPPKLLGHLKAGKRVVQLCCPGVEVAVGLSTAPDFADRFRAFRIRLDAEEAEFKGFLAYLTNLTAEVR